jgi:NDP-4-keto-2,6-dideoxyhexose 3-C-methyltransferase
MVIYNSITHCRICASSELVDLFSFGAQYLATAFVKSNADHPLVKFKVPLSVTLCRSCGLVQLKETVRRDILFHDYFYRSATNPMMRLALKEVADDFAGRLAVEKGDFLLDVGCNDGTMLGFFDARAKRIGIEPARNIDWSGVDPSIRIVNDFFSKDVALGASGGRLYKGITSVAMLYSVEDVNVFAAQVRELLTADGVWCIQVSYLPAMLDTMSFYDICHEHLYYFSLKTLGRALERHGLEIFDASTNDVNGGSVRLFATHKNNAKQKTERLRRLIDAEERRRLDDAATFEAFFRRVGGMREAIRAYIRNKKEQGRLVVGLGASTKGNVLLQFFGLDRGWLPYISERNPEKVSLHTLGTDIELISEEKARALSPSCMLVLIWFFKQELIAREREYLAAGGALLFPMPYPHIVTKDGERSL